MIRKKNNPESQSVHEHGLSELILLRFDVNTEQRTGSMMIAEIIPISIKSNFEEKDYRLLFTCLKRGEDDKRDTKIQACSFRVAP